MEMKKKSKKKLIFSVALTLVIIIGLGGFIYINDYYRSTDGNEAYLKSTESVKVLEIKEGLLFDGAGTEKALIFYPGGKVEYTAYAPIVRSLAENGMDCFLVKMPANLAVFGMNKAEDIMEKYGTYKDWYMAGHSLGGAMAASYVSDNLEDFAGLVLLAAYPTKSLIPEADDIDKVRKDLWVLTIYGTEDKVVNNDNLSAGYSLMPEKSYTEVLTGGNHAWFGNYGEQEGDGTATLTHEEQWKYTIEAVLEHAMQQ